MNYETADERNRIDLKTGDDQIKIKRMKRRDGTYLTGVYRVMRVNPDGITGTVYALFGMECWLRKWCVISNHSEPEYEKAHKYNPCWDQTWIVVPAGASEYDLNDPNELGYFDDFDSAKMYAIAFADKERKEAK